MNLLTFHYSLVALNSGFNFSLVSSSHVTSLLHGGAGKDIESCYLVYSPASKPNSPRMRWYDSYNYSELRSNSVAWQQPVLGPFVFSWESPHPLEFVYLGSPEGEDLAINTTRDGPFMARAVLIFQDRIAAAPDLTKIGLSLSFASFLTHNVFFSCYPTSFFCPKRKTKQSTKVVSFGKVYWSNEGCGLFMIDWLCCSSLLPFHAW